MAGSPGTVLDKPKFHGLFDSVYVSARAAACMNEEKVRAVFGPKCVVAVETGKFMVPLHKEAKVEFVQKEVEYVCAGGKLSLIDAPVPRRRRDEQDMEDDVIFFMPTQ